MKSVNVRKFFYLKELHLYECIYPAVLYIGGTELRSANLADEPKTIDFY